MLDLFFAIDPDVRAICQLCHEETANLGGVCTVCLDVKRQARSLSRAIARALREPRGKRQPRCVACGVGVARAMREAGR